MSPKQLQLLALVQASMARIEGMKAENQLRATMNDSPAYGYGHFAEEAEELSRLSVEAINS